MIIWNKFKEKSFLEAAKIYFNAYEDELKSENMSFLAAQSALYTFTEFYKRLLNEDVENLNIHQALNFAKQSDCIVRFTDWDKDIYMYYDKSSNEFFVVKPEGIKSSVSVVSGFKINEINENKWRVIE